MQPTFNDLGDTIQINLKLMNPNTVLACPTFEKDGAVVHPAYTPFTREAIDKLITSGIEYIYYSKQTKDVQPLYAKDLHEYLEKNVYKGPRAISIETQKKAIKVSDKIIKTVQNKYPIDFVDDTKEVVERVLEDIENSDVEIFNLLDIQSYDDFTYSHSLNAGVIAMLFGRKLGMSEQVIKDLGLASFLHDIGKIRLPYDLLNKKGVLTTAEFELIKKHSRYGYEIIKECTELSEQVKKIVLLHHEHFDGSGYPFGFRGDQIDDVVYVIGLAEFYDALTTELSYKKAFSSQETLNIIVRNSGSHFKPEMAHQFIKEISTFFKESKYYTIGCYVLLNTKEVAKIVSKQSEMTTRPGVEILRNEHGKQLPKPLSVNLELDGTRYIERILNIESNN